MVVLPPPSTVIPFPVTVTLDAHATTHGPGTRTVSPLDAELTAFCTSLCEQVAALMVVAWAGRHQNKRRATMICILIEDHLGTLKEQRVAAIPSFYFFFSSRRRHTRLTCDWSSDVCSSD